MKKNLYICLLGFIGTAAMASTSYVNGEVVLGVDSKYIGNEQNPSPIVLEATIDGKKCLVSAQAVSLFSNGDGVERVGARLTALTCDKSTKPVRGWVYDTAGNFGAKSFVSGTEVKIGFYPEISGGG